MEIKLIKNGHPFWEKTIQYAMNCNWKAGPFLAKKMIDNDFRDWERVIAAVEEEKIVAYCTISEKDELPERYGYTPFVGFIFVDEGYRGKRISEQMIDLAAEYAKELGYSKLFIMSGERGLYEKYGFEKIGDYKTVYGTIDQLFVKKISPIIEYRPGTKQDLDDIYILIQQAIAEMEKHGIFQWDNIYPGREDFEKDIDNHTLYLAYKENTLAALYVISGECDDQYSNGQWEYDEKSAYILHRFCVSPAFQNQGIGKAVLQHIEEQIKGMGYESVRLDTFTENPFANKLYLHNGYEPRGYANWRKGKFVLMEKKL